MNFLQQFFLFLVCVGLLSSCKEEPVPAYLYIPSISVDAKNFQGSSSSNISDVWVYQNFNLQGTYELPVEFPIIADGETQFYVYAGIELSGISTLRAIYPFYDADTLTVTFRPGQVDTVHPVVTYSSNAQFVFIENFENVSNFSHVERISGSDVAEGNYSGRLIADTTLVIAKMNADYPIPFNSTAVFLEMDYKNTHVFAVSMNAIYGTDTVPFPLVINVPPREEWNKLYANFTREVNQSNADSYQVVFHAGANANPNSVRIFLDNLKLIHAKV